MSFVNELELGRSAIGNIKNHTWSVYSCYKVYEDEGKAIVAYVESLKDRIKELGNKEDK